MNKPIVPTNLACAWCKGGPIEPVDECYWTTNEGEVGDGVGRWMQVYWHPGCAAIGKAGEKWIYQIAWLPDPRTEAAQEEK